MFKRWLQHEIDRFEARPVFWIVYITLCIILLIVSYFPLFDLER